MKTKRNNKGAALAFGASLALVIVVLGLGFLAFSMYMGGQQETVNAIDSGALNVGRQMLDDKSKIGTKLNVADERERCFLDVTNDVADPGNKGGPTPDLTITLRRVNRVWAEAMLMAINAEAAGKPKMVSNAGQALEGAQHINDRLEAQLTKPSNFYDWFTNLANANSVRMLGKNSAVTVVPGNNWQTSFMQQGIESNISLSGGPPNFNLPPGYSFDNSYATKTKRQINTGANLYFLKGYTPLRIGSTTFWQVPFEYDEKPHLVAQSSFVAGQKSGQSGNGYSNPIPNAYAVEGKGGNAASLNETAVARVLTNPREPFQMAIPHGFIHIKVDQMKAHWYFFPAGFPIEYDLAESDVEFYPDTQMGTPMPLGGVCCSMVTPDEIPLGTEVAFTDIEGDIYNDPPGNDQSAVDAALLNRVNEMITVPGKTLTQSDLESCLHSYVTRGALLAKRHDFYIFSPDGASIKCLPDLQMVQYPLIAAQIANDPDGDEFTISSDSEDFLGPPGIPPFIVPEPNFGCTPTPGASWEWSTLHKEIYWQPGTGYNGNLGQLRIKRWTNVYVLGVCNPI